MTEILPILFLCIILAYCSQNRLFCVRLSEEKTFDVPLTIMIIVLCLFCGLRINYNDTYLYIWSFKNAVPLSEFLKTQPEITENPFFYALECIYRNNISDNLHLYLLSISVFTNTSLILFIRKFTTNFTLSITIYFSIGLYYDTLGAMKQTLAIAILTYALRALFKKKYALFYIIVILAMLFHTYAIFFAILPLFTRKPWTLFTYVTIVSVIVLLLSFQSTLEFIMSAAENTGKHINSDELLDNLGINPFRLAVFGVPTILSFIFQTQLEDKYTHEKSILMNMSIISFLIMFMGIFTAANLFGRCSGYFELGSIIMLPWILDKIFDERSVQLASVIVVLSYLTFFYFLSQGFDAEYAYITFSQFIQTLKS